MVDRLFQIVYILMDKPKITAKELAKRLEVSERTIYRDIDKLSLAGIPIYANQGRDGGICISSDYVLNKAVITEEEKMQLSASFGALNELANLEAVKDISKLQNFFGDKYQDWLEIDFSSWGNLGSEAALLNELKKTILEHRYIEIEYSSNHNAFMNRTIRPLKLCFKDQAWYLYAFCCLREDYRFFKLKRITNITILDSYFPFESVGKILQKESGENISQKILKVSLEIDNTMAFRVYDEFTNVIKTKENKLLCNAEIEESNIEWFVSYVLSYGPHIKVCSPEVVKEKVAMAIKKMANLYEENV